MNLPRGNFAPTLNDGTKVFVFGANGAGIHGAGAAKTAKDFWGAINGVGEGIQGQSYGIPTKDNRILTLPLSAIRKSVYQFILYARAHPEKTFLVTRIGCGLAGYSEMDIAPMFASAPSNCELPEGWRI